MENKLNIKDLFSEESIQENTELKDSRMIQLLESFDNKNEVIREKSTSQINEEKLNAEKKRLKEIAKLEESTEDLNEANKQYFTGNIPSGMGIGIGQTVNTFMGNNVMKPGSNNQAPGATVNTLNQNIGPNANKPYNPNYTYLQSTEAIRLAISRALGSGAPVNNLGFYEEVNWILNGLGFNAKSPLDIKQAILKMIKD